MWRISRRYGVSVRELSRLNDVDDPTRVQAGDRLRIPGPPAPLRDGGLPPVGSGPPDEAALLLDLARRAIGDARFEEAGKRLETARRLLEHSGGKRDGATTAARWVELETSKALVEIAYGRHDAAVDCFERAIARDPGLDLEEDQLPPKLLSAWREAAAGRAPASAAP